MNTKYFYASLAIIPVGILILGLFLLTQSPYTGLNFTKDNGKWYISSIHPDSPASKYPELKGKELIAINEHTLGKYDLEVEFDDIPTWSTLQEYWYAKKEFMKIIKPSVPITLTINDNGIIKIFSITPKHITFIQGIQKSWPILLSALLHLFIALIIIIKKNNNPSAKLFAISIFLLSILYITIKLIHSYDISYNLAFLQFLYIIYGFTNIFATLFLLQFFLIFPRDLSNIQNNKIFLAILYVFAILTYILSETKIFYLTLYIYLIFSVLLGIYFLIKHYLKLNSLERTQVRLLYFGFSIILLIDVFAYLLPPLFIGHRIVEQEVMFLLLGLLPVLMAFSIMRYKLMNITTLFDNTLVYAITLGGLALADIVIINSLVGMGILTAANTPMMIALSVWGIALIYMWLRNFVQDKIKILLKREIYNTNDVSLSLSKKLFSAHEIKDAFAITDNEIKKTLHPKSTNAYLFDKSNETALWEGVPRDNVPLSRQQIEQLTEATPVFTLVEEPDNLPDNYTGGVIIPISNQNRMIGYIAVQDKQSDRLYDSEDIKLFNIISNQLAMAVDSLLAKEEVAKKEREALLEKERLSREIHDGIGSRFVEASMLSDQIVREANNPDKTAKYGKSMKTILLDGLSDLRELIWAVEPGPSNLNTIISHVNDKLKNMNERDGFKVTSHIELANEEVMIPAIKKLNLIRIIQESLTNTIKHAKATEMEFSLIQEGDTLTIEIKDNGTGFDTNQLKKAGHGVRNIIKRCNDIGAILNIDSGPDKGTKITITLTLQPEDETIPRYFS